MASDPKPMTMEERWAAEDKMAPPFFDPATGELQKLKEDDGGKLGNNEGAE